MLTERVRLQVRAMSKFRVGQRVRIKWSLGWPELAGEEGRITGEFSCDGPFGKSDWEVAPDSWGSCRAPKQGVNGAKFFAPSSDQLSPIIDLHEPAELDIHELLPFLKEMEKA